MPAPALKKIFGVLAIAACAVFCFAAAAHLLPRAHRCRLASKFDLPCNQSAERRRKIALVLAACAAVSALVAFVALKPPSTPTYPTISLDALGMYP